MADRIITPTGHVYNALDEAHAFFNKRLFDGKLPLCLITYTRHKNSRGYFSPGRFRRAHVTSKTKPRDVDEIAINPEHVEEVTRLDILGTLVHEMCHQWEFDLPDKPTRAYHSRRWAARMKEVGLQPSHTGQPGGKETGPQMTHYIIPGGRFEIAAKEFIKEQGEDFQLYQDVSIPLTKRPKKAKGGSNGEGEEGSEADPKSPGRVKYTCPGECGLNVWAKPKVRIACMDCSRALEQQE